ncbi:helix-turn-helix domain-containing protein [Streptomyces sp. NPDC059851]|uniref:helix-turn-helix domain-containing protein n=1 Tax=Streptomyces sp. NPDC059851 TaxID=3346971 RepID=UPI003664EFB9
MITILEQPLFGQRVRELRTARGLSQAALAEPGMSTSYLSRLESGARPPTAKVVAYLAERLEVPRSAFDNGSSSAVTQLLARGISAADGRGGGEDILDLLNDAVEVGTEVDTALHWQMLWMLTMSFSPGTDTAHQEQTLTRLVRLSDEIGLPELQVRSRVKLARFQRLSGSPELGSGVAEEAVALAREPGVDAGDLGRALLTAVSAEAESGRLTLAREHVDELCSLIEAHAELPPSLAAEARWSAASVRVRQGEYEAARDHLEAAMRNLDSHDDLLLWTRLRIAAASLYLQMTPRLTDRAAAALAEAEVPIGLIGTPLHEQEFHVVTAQLAFYQGDFERAEELCVKLASEPSLLSYRDGVRLEMLRIRLRFQAGAVREAVNEMTALATRLQDSSNTDLTAEAWRNLAEALTAAAEQSTLPQAR